MAWVALDAVGGQQLDQLVLAGDGVLGQQLGDPVLALRPWLSCHRRSVLTGTPPSSQPDAPRAACMPVGGLGPDPALRTVEHVVGDLFAPVGGQAVQEDGVGAAA